jgi:tetratricopeptide (TPR) repeat protein
MARLELIRKGNTCFPTRRIGACAITMRWICAIFVMSCVWALAARAQNEVAPDEPVTTPQLVQFRLERAAASIDQMRYTAALMDLDEALRPAVAEPAQEDWARYLRARALTGVGRHQDGETEVRTHFAKRPSAYNFKSVMAVLTLRKRWAAGAQAVLDLPETQFVLANGAPPQYLLRVLSGLTEEGQTALRERLLERLVLGAYTGPWGGKTDDHLRLEFIARLTAAGQIADAAKQTKYLETPSVLIALLADKKFEPLWSTPEVTELSAKALQARVKLRAEALRYRGIKYGPEAIEAVRAFRAAGEAAKAVDTADRSLPVISARPGGRRFARQLLIEKAYALADQGRASAASNLFDQLLRDYPEDPIAIRLAHARVLEAAGEGGKALAVLDPLDPESLSVPARAVALQISVCAQSTGADSTTAKDALAELRDMGLNAAPALLDAFLCVKDDEGARTLVLAWLLRSDIRQGAVAALQLYAEPKTVLPALADRRRRLQALLSRDDVQTALKPYGRTMGWSFQRATALSY